MNKLSHLFALSIISTVTFSSIPQVEAEEPPRLSEDVFRKYSSEKKNGVERAYPLAQLPMLFKTITESKSAADMFKQLSREDTFPMSFIGNDPKLGKVHLYIFNVWVSEEARMMGQNSVYVHMYYALPFHFEKRGHIQQPVEVHW